MLPILIILLIIHSRPELHMQPHFIYNSILP